MNIYVVVEGEGETKVYPKWINVVNPSLSRVLRVDLAAQDNYFLVSGNGYPQYLDIVENAIQDIATYPQYDRLVVVVDSEDATQAAKVAEIGSFINGIGCRVPHRVVVQHFCLETWALGNRRVFQRNPQNPELRKCVDHYDLTVSDPELMLSADADLTRAQYAFRYLRLLLRERNPRLVYSKRNPSEIGEPHYLARIRERYLEGHHIQSFGAFPAAFV